MKGDLGGKNYMHALIRTAKMHVYKTQQPECASQTVDSGAVRGGGLLAHWKARTDPSGNLLRWKV